ncbi:hypothetical protein AALP_AA4G140700 [Arabis alpina]|uniref:Ribonucleoside-diphosphate reductase n=1 Tax=Arabis alpina TaxID=50452 RepID=A0A087H368_ARAAL|nr:hypothetical protein AALP_AA4G140700 [Arabis alpina]
MLMRVAVGIHKDDIDSAIKTYHLMSQRWFTHASPTLRNAGTSRPQLSSGFLIFMKDDNIEGIYKTLKECAAVSNSGGNIGVSVHNAPATGSYISIVPMLRVFNDTARYVDEGGGKRTGAFAVYLEPWHADIFEYLELQKKHGKEFERLYTKYETEGKTKTVIEARELWFEILTSQLETEGTLYIFFKDSCNRKSNQQNIGTIKSSSLCGGIIEYTSPTETAVCSHASIALPRFVREKNVPLESHPSKLAGSLGSKNRFFDFDMLAEVTATVTIDLERIIDVNHYHVETARTSNKRHRSIGIGVQGLADAFILLGMPFDSLEARQPCTQSIFRACCKRWCVRDLQRKSREQGDSSTRHVESSMPTASTSQILGNDECFEPYTSNIYNHKDLSGEFIVLVNKHLLHDLTEIGLWTQALKNKIIHENGFVANVSEIPQDLKQIYRSKSKLKHTHEQRQFR